MNPKVFPKWLGRYPIVDADHVPGLEIQAGINEMLHKQPRHEAESAAHEQYRKDQLTEAAAHHLLGIKGAHAAGSMDEARKHGVLYALAMKQLGHDPVAEPPAEVKAKEKNLAQTKPVHKFKSHKGDAFSLPEIKEEGEPVKKAEPLEKRSKNVRQQVSNITPQQAEQRRVKYAQTIGLKPVKDMKSKGNFPQAVQNRLPYEDDFQVEHETAHAMMTPQGKTVRQYQNELSSTSQPKPQNPDKDYPGGDGSPDEDHMYSQHQENVANALENRIDRRAGVSPQHFRSQYRNSVVKPKDQEEMPEGWIDEAATARAKEAGQKMTGSRLPPGNSFLPNEQTLYSRNRSADIPGKDTSEEARDTAENFDEGAKFDQYGRLQHSRWTNDQNRNETLNQKINRGHSGTTWLRDVLDRANIRAQNARMNGGRGPGR